MASYHASLRSASGVEISMATRFLVVSLLGMTFAVVVLTKYVGALHELTKPRPDRQLHGVQGLFPEHPVRLLHPEGCGRLRYTEPSEPGTDAPVRLGRAGVRLSHPSGDLARRLNGSYFFLRRASRSALRFSSSSIFLRRRSCTSGSSTSPMLRIWRITHCWRPRM